MNRREHFGHRRRFGIALLVPGVLLALVASTALAAGPGQPAPSAGQTTALIVSATNAPLRVLGSDGMEHLEYDLVITNVFTAPATLTAIEVIALDGSLLLRLEGDALVANTQPVFFTTGPPTDQVPVAGTVATVIDLVVPPGQIPERITHRITYDLPADTPALFAIGSRTIAGPELAVNPRGPLVIAPPLRGNGWFNGSGCCAAGAQHRVLRLAVDGLRYAKPETFAIDWARLQDGQLFAGDGSRNEQWFDFGAEVVSVADGTVVSVRDGMPEETPGQPSVAVKGPEDQSGNHAVVQVRSDVWAVCGHLQPGSINVRVGDRLTAGQPLARLGNTGNSSAPHLHFQLSDSPDVTSNSLPFVFDRYTLAGTVDPKAFEAASSDNPDAPPDLPVEATMQPQAGTYPLYLSVVDFP